MRRMNAILVAAVLGLVACGHKEGSEGKAQTAPAPVLKGVTTAVLSETKVKDVREALGTVRATETVTLSSKLMGTIVSLPLRVGSRVAKGDVVAKIDSRDLAANIDKARAGIKEADEGLSELASAERSTGDAIRAAEAQRDLANATYGRFKTLNERGSVSRQEFDEVEARFKAADAEVARVKEMLNALAAKKRQLEAKKEQANADIAAIKANLAYDAVLSPVNGVVIQKAAEEGMLAAPGAPIVMIEEEGRMRLEAAVEESMLGGLKVGDAVTVTIDAFPGEREGRVNEVNPIADAMTRTALVKISIKDQKNLRTGLSGRAFFSGEERKALYVPTSAVVLRGQLTGVYVVDGANIAHLRLIKVGRMEKDGLEVLSGLNPGDKVATTRTEALTDGARVE